MSPTPEVQQYSASHAMDSTFDSILDCHIHITCLGAHLLYLFDPPTHVLLKGIQEGRVSDRCSKLLHWWTFHSLLSLLNNSLEVQKQQSHIVCNACNLLYCLKKAQGPKCSSMLHWILSNSPSHPFSTCHKNVGTQTQHKYERLPHSHTCWLTSTHM